MERAPLSAPLMLVSMVVLAFEVGEGSEFLGSLSLALTALGCAVLPFNLIVLAVRKWRLFEDEDAKRRFNDIVKKVKPPMTWLHVIACSALMVVVAVHAWQVWGVVQYPILHYVAVLGILVLLVTGILALYVPLPPKVKRAVWTVHAKYVLFAAVFAMIGVAHLLVSD